MKSKYDISCHGLCNLCKFILLHSRVLSDDWLFLDEFFLVVLTEEDTGVDGVRGAIFWRFEKIIFH